MTNPIPIEVHDAVVADTHVRAAIFHLNEALRVGAGIWNHHDSYALWEAHALSSAVINETTIPVEAE